MARPPPRGPASTSNVRGVSTHPRNEVSLRDKSPALSRRRLWDEAAAIRRHRDGSYGFEDGPSEEGGEA